MTNPNARKSFSTLVAAAFVDGRLADQEREFLHRKATLMDIPLRELSELIAQGEHGKLTVTLPPSKPARQELLDDLIELVCADGRVEAPEQRLLANVAGHLKVDLQDLRARIKDRMERPRQRTEPLPPGAPAAPPSFSPAMAAPPPMVAPASLTDSPVPEIPPVTLQLLKQTIAYESPAEALRAVERMLAVPRLEAEVIVRKILAAFPDLKQGSDRIGTHASST